MSSVIHEAEVQIRYSHDDFSNEGLCDRDYEKKMLIRSALEVGESLDIRAIVIFTKSGLLARLAASFRPNKEVYAFTPRESSVRYMNALFGIEPILLADWGDDLQENLNKAIVRLKSNGTLVAGDRIVAVNDIQKEGKEIPVMEIITIE